MTQQRNDEQAQSPGDAVDLIIEDHRRADELFQQYESQPASTDGERRRALVDQMIKELSVHATVEEEVLYPAIREALPEGEELASESLDEHRRVRELLAQLDGRDPSSAGYDQLVLQLIDDVRQHVEEEESDLLPRLREAISPERLAEMRTLMERVKQAAPDRPLPYPSYAPPGEVVAGRFPDLSADLSDEQAEATMEEPPEPTEGGEGTITRRPHGEV